MSLSMTLSDFCTSKYSITLQCTKTIQLTVGRHKWALSYVRPEGRDAERNVIATAKFPVFLIYGSVITHCMVDFYGRLLLTYGPTCGNAGSRHELALIVSRPIMGGVWSWRLGGGLHPFPSLPSPSFSLPSLPFPPLPFSPLPLLSLPSLC